MFNRKKDYVEIPAENGKPSSRNQASRFAWSVLLYGDYYHFILAVFMLTGQEGKLFHPLAYTKTFILIVDAFWSSP